MLTLSPTTRQRGLDEYTSPEDCLGREKFENEETEGTIFNDGCRSKVPRSKEEKSFGSHHRTTVVLLVV